MFVPSGSNLTWVGVFDAGAFYNQAPTDAVNQASAYLKNNYNMIVTGSDFDGSDTTVPITMTLSVTTQMDRGNTSSDDGEADIQSNIEDAFAVQGNPCSQSSMSVNNLASAPVSSSAPGIDYDTCSTFSDKVKNALPTWLGGTPVTPNQQSCYAAAGAAQVTAVGTNAAVAYGSGSAVATATQAAAAQQSAQVATDVAGISDAARKAAASSDTTTLYIAGGIALAIVVLLIVTR